MPSGGARKNAGRKPKPLAEKLAAGNPGHRPLKKLEFDGRTRNQIDTPDDLAGLEKDDYKGKVASPVKIFEEAVKFLEPSRCLHLISPGLLSDYAMAKYYLKCAQYQLKLTAIVGLNKKEEVVITSFTEAMLKLQKNVLATWEPIWAIVSQNSERLVGNPEQELLTMVMGGRIRKNRRKEHVHGTDENTENPGSAD